MHMQLRPVSFLLALAMLVPGAAQGQMLSTLWPNSVGNRWEYDALLQEQGFPDETFEVALELTASVVVNGDVEVQLLQATQLPLTKARPQELAGFWRTLWLARPDLRAEIERVAPRKGSADYLPFDLIGEGLLRITSNAIGLWREDLNGWAIWYLTTDLTPGATFTLQLVPDLASDVFLYGTVEAVGTSVTVPAGTFSDAVEMSYRIDFGQQTVTDVDGTTQGTFRVETHATSHFVPLLGLVRHVEEFGVVEADCPDGCPDIEAQVGVVARHGQLELRLKTVATDVSSWGAVKSAFVE